MTAPQPRASSGEPDDTLRAFSRHLDAIDHRQDELAGSVNTLGELITGLSKRVAANSDRPAAPSSWLALATEPDRSPTRVIEILTDLSSWVATVFRRYADGDASLPDCWLRHPDVVEELLWLRTVWCAAYRSPAASAALSGDWHDRYRPGVARRIRATAATCSPDNHGAEPTQPSGPDRTELEALARRWIQHCTRDSDGQPA